MNINPEKQYDQRATGDWIGYAPTSMNRLRRQGRLVGIRRGGKIWYSGQAILDFLAKESRPDKYSDGDGKK